MKVRISQHEIDQSIFAGLIKSDGVLYKSGFDQKLLELVKLRVAQINGCAYCIDMHYKEAIDKGETSQRLYSLPVWKDTPYYTKKERAILAFTEAVTNINKEHFKDQSFIELENYYNKQEIALITLAILQINSWTRLNITFNTVPGNYIVGQYT